MRKIAESVTRVNVKVPSGVADWLKAKATSNGMSLSDQMRHLIIDAKACEDALVLMGKTAGKAAGGKSR